MTDEGGDTDPDHLHGDTGQQDLVNRMLDSFHGQLEMDLDVVEVVEEPGAQDIEEDAVAEADRILCGETVENATVKELQNAINTSRPFGLKIWKPALYKKHRSIATLTENAIHEDPDQDPSTHLPHFISVGSLLWLFLVGWWLYLVYFLTGCAMLPFALVGHLGLRSLVYFSTPPLSIQHLRAEVQNMVFPRSQGRVYRMFAITFFELERAWEYALLSWNFAWYMFWPFGKFIIKKRRPTRRFISSLPDLALPRTAQSNSESAPLLHQHQQYQHPTNGQAFNAGGPSGSATIRIDQDDSSDQESDSEWGFNSVLEPTSWNVEDSDDEENEDSSSDSDSGETGVFPTPSELNLEDSSRYHEPDVQRSNRRARRAMQQQQLSACQNLPWRQQLALSFNRSWTRIREMGPAGILFRFLAIIILTPVHLFVSLACFLGVFTVPMSRLTFAVLQRLMKLRCLSVRAVGSDERKRFGSLNSASSSGARKNKDPNENKKEYRIILCTNHAAGWRYYKYTFDGINIILINLNAIVVFTLFDFYYLGPALDYKGIGSHESIFLSALISVIPLAYLIGMAVSSITAQTGSLALGSVVNATFGSIVEIILYCLALMEGKTRMVEGSIIGSFMAGLLALPGVSMFFGGLMRKEQKFNTKAAGVTSTLLIMAILGVFGPTFFQGVYGTFELHCAECPIKLAGFNEAKDAIGCRQCRYRQPHPTEDPIYMSHTRPLMLICTTVLILMYAIGLLFTLHTHSKTIYPTEPKRRKYRLSSIPPPRSDRLGPSSADPMTPSASLLLSSPALRPLSASFTTSYPLVRTRMTSHGATTAATASGTRSPNPAHEAPAPRANTVRLVPGLKESPGLSATLARHPGQQQQPLSPHERRRSMTVGGTGSAVMFDLDYPLRSSMRGATNSAGHANVAAAKATNRLSADAISTEDDDDESSSGSSDGGGNLKSSLLSMNGGSASVGLGIRQKKSASAAVDTKGKAPRAYESGFSTAQSSAGDLMAGMPVRAASAAASVAAASGGGGGGGHGHGGHDHPNWSAWKSAVVLLMATLFFSIIAEVLIDSVDHVIDSGGGKNGLNGDGKWVIDEKILGLTLFAIVPTITEFYNAIAFARQGNIALSLEIGSAYTIQVALLQIPALVAFSEYWRKYGVPAVLAQKAMMMEDTTGAIQKYPFWKFVRFFETVWQSNHISGGAHSQHLLTGAKDTFTLLFPKWDVFAVLFGVFTVTYLYIEGKSNYFKGAMLLLAYALLMCAFVYAPPELSMDSY
ncbi:hypothetical protein HDU81_003567 [Chytriomyces hyalinus]|nr:hypothetical protein HDU81_003567 [Chytriomyces hyalinus]